MSPRLRIAPGPGYDEWRRAGCPGEVRVGRLHIADTPPEEAEEFFVYQYLIVATPRNTAPARPLTENGQRFQAKNGNGVPYAPESVAAVVRTEVSPPADGA